MALLHALEAVPDGVTEFMVHPGLVDDQLRQLGPRRAGVQADELAALPDPGARAAVEAHAIQLVSFAALAPYGPPPS